MFFASSGFPRFIRGGEEAGHQHRHGQEGRSSRPSSTPGTAPFPSPILTNFYQFRLYDTTLKPILQRSRAGAGPRIRHRLRLSTAQWDAIPPPSGARLSRAVRSNASRGNQEGAAQPATSAPWTACSSTSRAASRSIRSFSPIWTPTASHFAAAIYHENKAAFPEADTLHGAARLTEAVQRIMDRLVFMRVIEDRGIVAYGTLRAMLERIGAEGGEFYAALCATFRDYDTKYNGYLYKPHFSEELAVADGTCWPISSARSTRPTARGTSPPSATTSRHRLRAIPRKHRRRQARARPTSRRSRRSATPTASTTRRASSSTRSSAALSGPRSPGKCPGRSA